VLRVSVVCGTVIGALIDRGLKFESVAFEV
jgi:hypothetical protein